MSVAITKVVELADIIYDYLIALDEIDLVPFLANWPSKPYKIRIVSQRTLPVLSCLPELVADANEETKRIVKLLEALAEHLA